MGNVEAILTSPSDYSPTVLIPSDLVTEALEKDAHVLTYSERDIVGLFSEDSF